MGKSEQHNSAKNARITMRILSWNALTTQDSPGTALESRFRARLHRHGDKCAYQNRGEKLTDSGLGDGEGSRNRREWNDFATHCGEVTKAEVRQLRNELVEVCRRSDEMKRTGS